MFPQVLQLLTLVLRFTSHPLVGLWSQSPNPIAHAAMPHAPDTQITVALASAHTAPHAPQLDASVERFSQCVLPRQSACPDGHTVVDVMHAPATHRWVVPHAVAQPPQCAASEPVFVSHPFPDRPSQSAHPDAQVPITHTPAAHVALALAKLHAVAHDPQCPTVSVRLVSQPLAGRLSQSPQPVSHAPSAHTPRSHRAAPCENVQTLSHRPQAVGSVPVKTHRPLQSVCPVGHTVWHTPAEHA